MESLFRFDFIFISMGKEKNEFLKIIIEEQIESYQHIIVEMGDYLSISDPSKLKQLVSNVDLLNFILRKNDNIDKYLKEYSKKKKNERNRVSENSKDITNVE